MYRKNFGKENKPPKKMRKRRNQERDERYSKSNFKLITYGPKRDRTPPAQRDRRLANRRSRRASRSPNRSGSKERRSRSRDHRSPRHRSGSRGRRSPRGRSGSRGRRSPRGRSGSRGRRSPRGRSGSRGRRSPRRRSGSRGRRSPSKERRSRSPDERHKPDVEDEEEKEEVNKRFHVLEIDFHIPENTEAHHTDRFECTKERDRGNKKLKPELVVRRGQKFVLTVTFDREYDKKQDDLEFTFTSGNIRKPSRKTSAEFDMDEDAGGKGHHLEWYAKMVEKKNNSIKVEITPPSNCIIGEWEFSILTSSKTQQDEKPMFFKYVYNRDITILLNPWCEHDEVFLATPKLLNEYILNDTGAVFQGNYKQINAKTWNFAQFEDEILEISLHLIRKHYGSNVDTAMADPIQLSRAITEIVNANDGGVLVGNWSGDYDDGTKPTWWSSSKNILKQYYKTGDGVKYGQCWVFSAITTTICRAIGLPARSVTNFSSAHDSDGSVAIDEEYERDPKTNKLKKLKHSDSIWNFHVWNEVWMRRNDLGMGYDGWQVIDSTPQELSGGVFRCGPAPLIAVKRGELGRMQYDCPFVFAEVNADVIKWEKLSPTKWKKIGVDTSRVGKNISTKVPDGEPYEKPTFFSWGDDDQRLDITHEYKYPEGTLEERLAVKNANKASKSDREVEESEHVDVVLEITDKDGILIGNSFDIEITAKNQSIDHKARTITNLDIEIAPASYTGDVGEEFAEKRFQNIRLKYKEEETFKFTVTPDMYLSKLWEQYMMNISATAHIKETDKVHIKDEDYRLRRPDIEVEAPKTAKRLKPFEIAICLKNPLPMAMTNCIVDVEANAIDNVEEKVGDIAANSTWKHTLTVIAKRKGKVTLNVSFDCKELRDITGYTNVAIED